MSGSDYKEFLLTEGWAFVAHDKPYNVFCRNEIFLAVCYSCQRLIKAHRYLNIREEGNKRVFWNRSLEQLKTFADEGIHGGQRVDNK